MTSGAGAAADLGAGCMRVEDRMLVPLPLPSLCGAPVGVAGFEGGQMRGRSQARTRPHGKARREPAGGRPSASREKSPHQIPSQQTPGSRRAAPRHGETDSGAVFRQPTLSCICQDTESGETVSKPRPRKEPTRFRGPTVHSLRGLSTHRGLRLRGPGQPSVHRTSTHRLQSTWCVAARLPEGGVDKLQNVLPKGFAAA